MSSSATNASTSSTRTQKPASKAKQSTSGSSTPSAGASNIANNNVLSELGMSFDAGDDAGDPALWDFGGATSAGGSGMPFASTNALSDQQSMALLQQQQQQLGMNSSLPLGSAVPPSSLFTSALQPSNAAPQPPLQNGIAQSPLLSTSRPTASQIPSHIAKNNPFLNKLRSMVDDPKTDDLIRWSDDGETFLVPNHERFGNEVLPRFFKHNRFSSFVRQLNMYGFHKVPHLQQGALKSDPGQDTELWEFSCPQFKRDRPELLLQMQRKKGVRVEDEAKETGKGKGKGGDDDGNGITLDAINGALTRAQRGEGETGMLQLASVWSAIQAIQSAQQGINDNLRHLHSNNNDLWREAAEQRARSKKQEETINKMLRFLAGVFGAQDVNNIGAHTDHRADTASPSTSTNSPRRSNVVLRPHQKRRQRLLIGDGTPTGGQIEELEVPAEDDDDIFSGEVEEPTPHGRITEARSGSNSPQNNSPPSRFINLPKTPHETPHGDGKQTALPSIASDATATPGGGRRISQQAGAQLLNALASGEAQSWLANMFGQQPGSANMQSPGTRNDNMNSAATGNGSFKLDAQTLAALQGILAGGAGTNDAQPNGYFDGSNGTSEPYLNVQPPQPSRTTPTAVSPRSQAANVSDRAQLARLNPQQQQLQNATQDANVVQNALNALVEGLRIESTNGTAAFGNDVSGVAPMAPAAAAAAAAATTPSRNGESSGLDIGQGDAAAANSEVDMDSLLKEFFNESGINLDAGAGGIAAGNELINGYDGQTPAFAFSPAPTADAAATELKSQDGSTGANTASSSTRNSPPHPAKATSGSRKRKPLDDDMLENSEAAVTATRSHGGKAKTTRQ